LHGGRGQTLRFIVVTTVVLVTLSTFYVLGMHGGVVQDGTEGVSRTSVAGDRILDVGAVEELEVYVLNPLYCTTSGEKMAIWPCYSTLLMNDPDLDIVGDLATGWSVSMDETSWHFVLSEEAVFFDKLNEGETHYVTSSDVRYTYWLVQNTTASSINGLLMMEGSHKAVDSIWTPTDHDVYINTSAPYAPMMEAFTEIPILPEYIWSDEDVDWTNDAGEHAACVGSGPFFYDLPSIPTTGYFALNRSSTWFHEQEDGWMVNVDRLVIREYFTDAFAWAALTAEPNTLDIVMGLEAATYNDEVPSADNITGLETSSGVTYALDVNLLTDELRTTIGGPLAAGDNSQLLQNDTIRRALAMCLDRDGIVADCLDGVAEEADSFFPTASPWHSEDVSPLGYDPDAARSLLVSMGWAYDSEGDLAGDDTVPLCLEGGGSPLTFRLATEDSLEEIGMEFRDAAAEAGLELTLSVETPNTMDAIYNSADYDLAIGYYEAVLTRDPSTGTMSRYTTMSIGVGGENRVYLADETFDSCYNDSLEEVDLLDRGDLVDGIQELLNENRSSVPIAHARTLYAANNRTWTNFGNWTSDPMLAPESALPWLYMSIELRGDSPHDLSISHEPSDAGPGETIWFNGSAVDDTGDELTYSWDFGDSESATGQNVTHVYDEAMAYTVTLTVTDPYGYEASYQVEIGVGVEIPEFGGVIVPVLILVAVVLSIVRAKRRESA
jgi:ABC-type transport system substrate-binding protein